MYSTSDKLTYNVNTMSNTHNPIETIAANILAIAPPASTLPVSTVNVTVNISHITLSIRGYIQHNDNPTLNPKTLKNRYCAFKPIHPAQMKQIISATINTMNTAMLSRIDNAIKYAIDPITHKPITFHNVEYLPYTSL